MDLKKTIKESFESYLNEYGFKLKRESETIIEFEHKILIISFVYDSNSSFEVDATFIPKNSNFFNSFLELKQYFDNTKNDYSAFQVLDEKTLMIWVIEVKDFFTNHLENLLINHDLVFIELEKQSIKNAIEYRDNKEVETFANDFNNLWKNKEYSKLIIFSENNLKNVQGVFKKKYDYSKMIINKK